MFALPDWRKDTSTWFLGAKANKMGIPALHVEASKEDMLTETTLCLHI